MRGLLAAVLALAVAPPASAEDAGRGKKLFVADGCSECHGTDAQGGPGMRLAPDPPPVGLIAAYIRHPVGEMPPYVASVVSDADIADIHAYLATIPKPRADMPDLK